MPKTTAVRYGVRKPRGTLPRWAADDAAGFAPAVDPSAFFITGCNMAYNRPEIFRDQTLGAERILSYRTSQLPAEPSGKPSSRRTLIIAVAGLFFLTCCLCAVVTAGLWAVTSGPLSEAVSTLPNQGTAPSADLGRDHFAQAQAAATFVQYLQSGNWPSAYAMCTPALQRQLGNAASLGKQIADARSQPVSGLANIDVGDVLAVNGREVVTVTGTSRFGSSAAGAVRIDLELVGSDWKVNGFSLNLGN